MHHKLNQLHQELKAASTNKKAVGAARFFKTGPGQYGEGDLFLGVTVPDQRRIVKKYFDLSLPDIDALLESKIHEHRSSALYILVTQFEKSDAKNQNKIYKFYLKNYKNINNWDLVDCSAPNIVGEWLLTRDRQILYKLAVSKNLWQKRVAIIATLTFIRNDQLADTFKIAEILINDKHDLIHKAVGWMLREAGKKDERALKKFLDQFATMMPRTMLRYAIERLNKKDYKYYLCLKP